MRGKALIGPRTGRLVWQGRALAILSRALGVEGKGPSDKSEFQREQEERGFLERLRTANSMKDFAKKGSREMER